MSKPILRAGRKLSKLEKLRMDYTAKREIRDKLLDQTDENGVFQGEVTEADAQRLSKLIGRGR